MSEAGAFDPATAGRCWVVGLNRHSSESALYEAIREISTSSAKECDVLSMINVPSISSAGTDHEKKSNDDNYASRPRSEMMIRMLYSWMKTQNEIIEKSQLLHVVSQTCTAWDALTSEKGVIIVPTTVGYTLAALASNATSLSAVKARSTKPFGILGAPCVYTDIFGSSPPIELMPFQCMGFMKKISTNSAKVPTCCYESCNQASQNGTNEAEVVGIWLNLGPIAEYLIHRAWTELGEVVIGSSCNMSGNGNPDASQFSVEALDANIVSLVQHTVTLKHWGEPELDEHGQWLSAPILSLDSGDFLRNGRDMNAANIVRDAVISNLSINDSPF